MTLTAMLFDLAFLLDTTPALHWWNRPSVTDYTIAALTLFYVVINIGILWTIRREANTAREAFQANEKQFGDQLAVARDSANAAMLTAKAMMHIERAWILADIEWRKTKGSVIVGADKVHLALRLNLRNQGKTLAWITETRIGFYIGRSIPTTPDFDATYVDVEDCFRSIEPGEKNGEDKDVRGYGSMENGSDEVGIIYGIVRYTDIFNQKRYTKFGYQFFPNINEFDRLNNHLDYNEHT